MEADCEWENGSEKTFVNLSGKKNQLTTKDYKGFHKVKRRKKRRENDFPETPRRERVHGTSVEFNNSC
jgi:hypothetical protein